MSRVKTYLTRHGLVRWIGLGPCLILLVFLAANWCSPDGIPAQPIDSFLLSLHSLDTQRSGKVRVLHFGDSHIASDNESAVVRTSLQRRFGDGGPGLVLPWMGPRLYTVSYTYGNTYGWERCHTGYNRPVDDMGLSLSYLETHSSNQSLWIQAIGSEFHVDYLAQPGGGVAEFLLDGVLVGQRSMAAASPEVRVAHFEAAERSVQHHFEIRTLDSGAVRILGVSIEKDSPGVVYSAMGLVGARAEYLLKCSADAFEAQISDYQPDLVILGYGTNESSGSYVDESAYSEALSTIIARIRRGAPSALVVLLTPPDRGDASMDKAQHIQRMLQEVMAAQRRVALNDNVILLDLHTAMGGAGSAEQWAAQQPPLARPDLTHFTNEGYNLLGRYIAGGIMKLYDSGADALQSDEGNARTAELLPPLYSGMTGSASLAAPERIGYVENRAQATTQIYYFLRTDGQVVVTNDLASLDTRQGRVISAEEAGCRLRRQAVPCDNTARW